MVGNFLGAIAEIAAGNIGAAADALEKGLARALKLVIDFLARLLRLSGITKKIQQAIEKIRSKVDTALDKVVKWIADKAKALVKKVVTAGVPKDPKERLDAALTAAQRATDKFADKPVAKIVLNPILSGIKIRYQLRSINLNTEGDRWAVEAEVNPRAKKVLKARFQGNIEESKEISDLNKIIVKEDGKTTGRPAGCLETIWLVSFSGRTKARNRLCGQHTALCFWSEQNTRFRCQALPGRGIQSKEGC
jgi:hypothetical protein